MEGTLIARWLNHALQRSAVAGQILLNGYNAVMAATITTALCCEMRSNTC